MSRFYNYGENETETPINAEFLNEIDQKLQHITSDENGTHFTEGVFANGNEIIADDDYSDPSIETEEITSEESEENNENV